MRRRRFALIASCLLVAGCAALTGASDLTSNGTTDDAGAETASSSSSSASSSSGGGGDASSSSSTSSTSSSGDASTTSSTSSSGDDASKVDTGAPSLPCTVKTTATKIPKSATTSASDPDDVAWQQPENAIANDNIPASSAVSLISDTSQLLAITNFSFGIPLAASIRGVTFHVRHSATAPEIEEDTVILTGVTGFSGGKADNVWPGNNAYTTSNYGGANDTWGTSLTPAIVNAESFGVRIAVKYDGLNSGGFAHIDSVTAEVTYCE